MNNLTYKKLPLAVTSLILFGVANKASAAGFQVNEMSPTIQATALADAATAVGDVSGMAYNPAVLATVPGTQIYVGGSIIMPDIHYNNAQGTVYGQGVDPNTFQPINVQDSTGGPTSGGNIAPTQAVPAVYVSTTLTPISPNLKVGIGVNTQWGLSTQYSNDWPGAFNAIDSTIKTVDISPTIAYKLSPNLAVGASLNIQHISATLSNNTLQQIPFAGAVDANVLAYNNLNASNWAVGYVLGTLITPRPGTNIGLDYRSPVVQHLNGYITGNILAADTNYNEPLIPPDSNYAPVYGSGDTTITLPAVINIGLSQVVTSKLTLMADAQYTDWNSFDALNITGNVTSGGFNLPFPGSPPIAVPSGNQSLAETFNLNWHGSWLYSLGGSYQLTPKWMIMAGLAYDETPTNNTDRDARIPDSSRQWMSTGFEYAATKSLSFDGTFTHIFMNDQFVNVTQTPTADQPTYNTSANYTGNANIIAAGVNYIF